MKLMAIVTGGQIAKFYESYSEIDVSFNKQVISYTGLNPYDVFIRVTGFQIPCFTYCSSMIGAKEVGGRKDITSVALLYEEPQISLEHKTIINQY